MLPKRKSTKSNKISNTKDSDEQQQNKDKQQEEPTLNIFLLLIEFKCSRYCVKNFCQ